MEPFSDARAETLATRARTDKVWEIFRSEYPDFCVTHAQRHREEGLLHRQQDDGMNTARTTEAEARLEGLWSHTEDQLNDAHAQWKREDAERQEAEHPLNFPRSRATESVVDYYAKAAFWTPDEGTALLLDRHPEVFTSAAFTQFRAKPCRTLKRFKDLRELVERSRTMRELFDHIRPAKFLTWAMEKHIEIPEHLQRAVEAHTPAPAEDQETLAQRADQIAALKAEITRLKASLEDVPSGNENVSMEPRERITLLKIVLGMAMACYEHDPRMQRQGTATAILRDFETIGISISDDSIRKYLSEAAEYAPPAETD